MTLDTVNITRASEDMSLPIAGGLGLAKLPERPAGRLGPAWGLATSFIWNFAASIEGAKRFLVDFVGSSHQALLASGFQSLPSWPGQLTPEEALAKAVGAGRHIFQERQEKGKG